MPTKERIFSESLATAPDHGHRAVASLAGDEETLRSAWCGNCPWRHASCRKRSTADNRERAGSAVDAIREDVVRALVRDIEKGAIRRHRDSGGSGSRRRGATNGREDARARIHRKCRDIVRALIRHIEK